MAVISLFLSDAWTKIWPYALIVGAVLAVLAGFYEKGRSAGAAAIQAKNQNTLIKAQKRNSDELQVSIKARDTAADIPVDKLRQRDAYSRD